MQTKIDMFSGKYYFLSNFFPAKITYNGITYQNSEAAFQAQKTLDENLRKQFATLPPNEAKALGRKLTLRSDWEDVKLRIMEEICKAKFRQNPQLKGRLMETGMLPLEEGNTWGDRYWGTCNGKGENHLGTILMTVRFCFCCEDLINSGQI